MLFFSFVRLFFIPLALNIKKSQGIRAKSFMKSLSRLLLLLCLLGGMTACTQRKEKGVVKGTCEIIELPLRQEENRMLLSAIADSLHYIPLETSDSCLIGSIDKLLRTDEGHFIVVDKEVASSVFLFDSEGNFLNQIGSRGQSESEYVMIEDVAYRDGAVFIWDGIRKKVMKYLENGTFVESYKFDYTAYSFECIGENLFAFCCDYTPNRSLFTDGRYPNLILFDASTGEVTPGLYFDEKTNSVAYMSVLNNLYNGNLTLPLNDTIYTVNSGEALPKYLLKYDEEYLSNKNAYIAESQMEKITADDALKASADGKFPQLLSYFECDSLSLLFMRMGGYLYYGFYYPDSSVYKEASSAGKYPIINDLDGSFLFSPRCVDGNKVYSLIEPSALPDDNKLPVHVETEDNPVLVEIYMKCRYENGRGL